MEKQEYKIKINAPRERVWDILWGDTTYPVWTALFSDGSRAETDWAKGSKVLFLNAANDGMVALIADKVDNELMSLKHIGAINKGVEDYDSPETKAWAGSIEEYRLKTADGQTELTVNMDITEEYKDYFTTTWPKALSVVKDLSEEKN
jgi:hypothetical protein